MHKINIGHPNTTLINTEIPERNTRVNTKMTIHMIICNKIYKAGEERTPIMYIGT
jgi:hypothetical protein